MQAQEQNRSRSPTQRRTVSTTWPCFGPHSDSGSTGSPASRGQLLCDVHEQGEAHGEVMENLQPEHEQLQPPVRALPHEMPREDALRDAGAIDVGEMSPTSRQVDEETHLYSGVWPQSPPPAQPRRAPRPMRDGHSIVGHLYAAENALVVQVIGDIENQVLPKYPLSWSPRGVKLWSQDTEVHINNPVVPRCLHPLDLRHGVWESRQKERYIPILKQGLVSGTVIVSWETPICAVQHRLDITCAADKHWRVMALTHEEWCIVALTLPPDIVEDLEELQELRSQQRGGTRYLAALAQPPVPYRLAHRVGSIYYYQPEARHEVIADMVCYLADQHSQSTDDVILITWRAVPSLG